MSEGLSSSLQDVSAFHLLSVANPACNQLYCWQMLCRHLEFRITSQQETCHVFNLYMWNFCPLNHKAHRVYYVNGQKQRREPKLLPKVPQYQFHGYHLTLF